MIFTLLAIVYELLNKEKVTATQLAQKYEISRHTVYRYINSISACGVPIITTVGKYGGISIDSKFQFSNLNLTKTQVCFLLTLCYNCPFENHMTNELKQKLLLLLNKYS